MSVTFELKAEARGDLGKGASRRLRRAGQVPAILYGGGQEPLYGGGQEPQPLVLNHLDVLNQLKNEAVYSHILTLHLGDRSESVVLRDLQRHPFKPTILHIDFLRVSADRELRVHVPLHFLNEETARGVKQQGGIVSRALIDLEVVCLPKNLPEFIEVDIAELGIGDALHLSQISLPAGVELATQPAWSWPPKSKPAPSRMRWWSASITRKAARKSPARTRRRRLRLDRVIDLARSLPYLHDDGARSRREQRTAAAAASGGGVGQSGSRNPPQCWLLAGR